jgi:fructose-specific phosphotransferase system IIA component
MRLVELIDERSMTLDLTADDREKVIETLVLSLHKAGRISELEPVLDSVIERERALSTGVGQGVAVPHATVDGLDGAVVAFGRHSTGVEFGALDELPVDLIFLLLAPSEEISLHLKLLSRVSRLCNKPEFREALRAADDPAQILNIIREHETELKEL